MGYFKLFLENEENEPSTPFVNWHKQYMQAYNAEQNTRNRNFYGGMGVASKKPETASEKLKSHPDSQVSVINIIKISGFSSGIHAYGDQDDVPAGNPLKEADWKVMDRKYEKYLIGKPAFIEKHLAGSYHEKWIDINVYVIADIDSEDSNLQSWSYRPEPGRRGPQKYERIIKHFTFHSMPQAIEIVKNSVDMEFPTAGESPTYDKILGLMKTPNPMDDSGYNSDDRYYRK